MNRKKKRQYIAASVILILGLFIGEKIGVSVEKKNAEKEIMEVTAQLNEKVSEVESELQQVMEGETEELPWNLVLVNAANPMEDGYEPNLAELEAGHSVDERIVDSAKQMLQDAKAAGLNVQICSAYRSVTRQETIFNSTMKDNLSSGLGYWDALVKTRQSVAEPGTSEHAMGLALDLVSSTYTDLDEGQAQTAEAKWLAENCYKYGFILRYPPEKLDITGIIYEPWHYRYVGVEDATKIMELGLTLEEYLEEYY